MSELEDPNSHSSELQEPHLDHHDTLEEQHQLQVDLGQGEVGHLHEQDYEVVEHEHEIEHHHQLQHNEVNIPYQDNEAAAGLDQVQHQHQQEHEHQHNEVHIPHQDDEAAAGLDQVQHQHQHQEQHVHMGIDHQHQQQQYHHHGVGEVPMTTLEGTEVAHIANMDATDQQQQHQHQNVQHVQAQQQSQMDDHANTHANANINMVDPSHNPVPVPMNVNANGMMQQHQQQQLQQQHPAAHGQHIMHHQHPPYHAQYQHPHVVVPAQPIQYAHQPNYQLQHQHQVGQMHEHEHEQQHQHQHQHQQHHEEQHHQHYQTHMHDEQQHQQQQQQQQMTHAGPAEMHWHDYFNLLQAHSTLTGTPDIEPNTNPPLEQWILDQRVLYQEDAKGVETILTSERKLLLDALGFDWVGESQDHQHHNQHHMHDGTGDEGMIAHAHLHSHEQHPHHEMDANQQQQQHPQEQQEYATHTQEQEDVHAAGDLTVNIGTVDEFNERLQQLQTFKDINGHCNIPPDYKEETMPDIAKWAIHQRQFYHEGSLTQDRVDALFTMGFDFHLTEGTDLKIPSFAERLGQLQEYKQLHGDIKISRNTGSELQGLGEWLHAQKLAIRLIEEGQPTSISEEHWKVLLDLGIDMTTPTEPVINLSQGREDEDMTDEEKENNRASKWDDKYHELKLYKQYHGHTNVPRRSKRDPSKDALGEWVHFQRRQHRNLLTGKNSTMAITRKKALDYLEFQWTRGQGTSTTTRTGTTYSTETKQAVEDQVKKIANLEANLESFDTWNLRCDEFRLYVQMHGDGIVPKNYRENPFLGRWVCRQRELFSIWRQTMDLPEYAAAGMENPNGMTKMKYERLLNCAFVFELPPVEGIDPTTGAPFIKANDGDEEEEPTMEDEDDIEIFVGFDTSPLPDEMNTSNVQMTHQVPVPEQVNAMAHTLEQQVAATEPAPVLAEQPQKEVELNESDVHAILDGKEEHDHHSLHAKDEYQDLTQQSHLLQHSHDVPMPSIQDGHVLEMQNAHPNDTHQHQEQAQMHDTEQVMEGQQQEQMPEPPPLRRLTAKVRVQWEERVLELMQFRLRKHHCAVPAKWKPNPDIAAWVWRQRVQYRRYRHGQPSVLTAHRICMLADLGFEFVALDHHGQPIEDADSKHFLTADMSKLHHSKKTSKKGSIKGTPKSRFKEGKWLESLAKVVKFKEEHGNCNVPRKWKRDPTLGEWVHFQRRQFRLRQLGRRNHMTDERIRKLETVGFEWSRGTSNQPSYIRVYEQNKEMQAQGSVPMQHTEHHGAEADVGEISVLDTKAAAEIAAVVEEQMRNPADAGQQQNMMDHHHQGHQVLEQQQYQHHEYQHQEGVAVDHNGQYQHPQYTHHPGHQEPHYHEEHINDASQEQESHI